jgi:hypothetical protein
MLEMAFKVVASCFIPLYPMALPSLPRRPLSKPLRICPLIIWCTVSSSLYRLAALIGYLMPPSLDLLPLVLPLPLAEPKEHNTGRRPSLQGDPGTVGTLSESGMAVSKLQAQT